MAVSVAVLLILTMYAACSGYAAPPVPLPPVQYQPDLVVQATTLNAAVSALPSAQQPGLSADNVTQLRIKTTVNMNKAQITSAQMVTTTHTHTQAHTRTHTHTQ